MIGKSIVIGKSKLISIVSIVSVSLFFYCFYCSVVSVSLLIYCFYCSIVSIFLSFLLQYLNGGAGCIAGAFMHERYKHNDFPKFLGWWGHKMESRFKMDNSMYIL